MLEAAHEDEDDAPLQIGNGQAQSQEQGGILGASTLAALQGFRAKEGQQKMEKAPAGPLVGYGSDSEDDD